MQGTGGSSAGTGVIGIGGTNVGVGVRGTGGSSGGDGAVFSGTLFGTGATIIGGSSGGPGLSVSASNGANAIAGYAAGTGYAGLFSGTASGGSISAIGASIFSGSMIVSGNVTQDGYTIQRGDLVLTGGIYFSGSNVSGSSQNVVKNSLTTDNICKAWANFVWTSGSDAVTIKSSYNIRSSSWDESLTRTFFYFEEPMKNGDYAVVVTGPAILVKSNATSGYGQAVMGRALNRSTTGSFGVQIALQEAGGGGVPRTFQRNECTGWNISLGFPNGLRTPIMERAYCEFKILRLERIFVSSQMGHMCNSK